MRIVIEIHENTSYRINFNKNHHALEFAHAIASNLGIHELFIVLSGLDIQTVDKVRAILNDVIPQEKIHVTRFHAQLDSTSLHPHFAQEAKRILREAYLNNLKPDVIYYSHLCITNSSIIPYHSTTCLVTTTYSQTDYKNQYKNSQPSQFDLSNSIQNQNIKGNDRGYFFVDSTASATELVNTHGVHPSHIFNIFNNQSLSTISSWNEIAKSAITAWESLLKSRHQDTTVTQHRPRLAYISPLPPEKTGIADYSSVLIPELFKYYEIDIITDQNLIDSEIKLPCKSSQWLIENEEIYDRVLYHFGNSHFHQHMFDLINTVPGVVVLHDFYLSGAVAHLSPTSRQTAPWIDELFNSHGYVALHDYFNAKSRSDIAWKYPCNLGVIQKSLGMVVHSEHSKKLAEQWYKVPPDDWSVIPLTRNPERTHQREQSRLELGFAPDDFIICSFGILGPTKLNHRLLNACINSELSKNKKCHLHFVGMNHSGDYGAELIKTIRDSGLKNIHITGWTDPKKYQDYLSSADLCVQLRTLSRGETSASVLDCMNHGIPTIVNANGSMADLSEQAVVKLPDDFTDEQLINALHQLKGNSELRQELAIAAREIVLEFHTPKYCSKLLFEAVESAYNNPQTRLYSALHEVAKFSDELSDDEMATVSTIIANHFPPKPRCRQILVDISAVAHTDLKTGIQRVVRAILLDWLIHPPAGWRVEPVYATNDIPGFRYARRFTHQFLGIPHENISDEPVDAWNGDVFIGLDLHQRGVAKQKPVFDEWYSQGVNIWFVVYDLLPILMPQVFPEGHLAIHSDWLQTVCQYNGVACISQSVTNDVREWLTAHPRQSERPFSIEWFHLGSDIDNTHPSLGLPQDANSVLESLRKRRTFLMVGSIEPRKGYFQTLEAFNLLWNYGHDVNLVIVGKEGWKPLSDDKRRDIPKTIQTITSHKELNHRLFWLDAISDEYLNLVYATRPTLIAASYGEGFGLPLIEAAQHNIPIIARDIPVFHEVAGKHAFYFSGLEPNDLASAIQGWIKLYTDNAPPSTKDLEFLTWKECSNNLLAIILGNQEEPAGLDVA